jgi:hypothetical protein
MTRAASSGQKWSKDGRLLTKRSLGGVGHDIKEQCVLETWIAYKESERDAYIPYTGVIE